MLKVVNAHDNMYSVNTSHLEYDRYLNWILNVFMPNNPDNTVTESRDTILAANSELSGWGVWIKSGECVVSIWTKDEERWWIMVCFHVLYNHVNYNRLISLPPSHSYRKALLKFLAYQAMWVEKTKMSWCHAFCYIMCVCDSFFWCYNVNVNITESTWFISFVYYYTSSTITQHCKCSPSRKVPQFPC